MTVANALNFNLVNGAVPVSNGGSGVTSSNAVVQIVRATTASAVTCTTSIPYDNTIPQNTEGTQVLTVTITPTSSTNKLTIEFMANCNLIALGVAQIGMAALFQDTTANALCTTFGMSTTVTSPYVSTLRYTMTAGTTSATTFKIRIGGGGGVTIYVNGDSAGGALFGGTSIVSLNVTETVS